MANRAHAPHAVIEDACQTAWARLCARQDVEVEAPHTVRWLVVVAVHEAWRKSGGREVTVGGWLPEVDGPAVDAPDPVAVAVSRDEARRRLERLTDRERQFLTLQLAGLTYREIAERCT